MIRFFCSFYKFCFFDTCFMYIDTHAHLDFPEFRDDFDAVLERLKAANVVKIINVGVDLSSSERYAEWSKQYDWMYAAIGLHPSETAIFTDFTDDILSKFRELTSSFSKVVAIGEIGLDYYRHRVPKEQQKEAFRKQLRLARELQKPVIIHCRDAYEDVYAILVEEKMQDVVFHCFTGSLEFARQVWDKGWMTSFTGIVTYPNALTLHEVVRAVPLDRCMVETDCPFLAPQRYRGKRNEPAYVVEVVQKIAELKNSPLEVVAKAAYENSLRFFGL